MRDGVHHSTPSVFLLFDYRRKLSQYENNGIIHFTLRPVGGLRWTTFYWEWGGNQLHGQVLLTSWLVLTIIVVLAFLGNSNLKANAPEGVQNLTVYITEFIRDLAKTQIGEEEYLEWVPFLGTIFLFIFVSNWSGALLPWRLIELPNGELAAQPMTSIRPLHWLS